MKSEIGKYFSYYSHRQTEYVVNTIPEPGYSLLIGTPLDLINSPFVPNKNLIVNINSTYYAYRTPINQKLIKRGRERLSFYGKVRKIYQ